MATMRGLIDGNDEMAATMRLSIEKKICVAALRWFCSSWLRLFEVRSDHASPWSNFNSYEFHMLLVFVTRTSSAYEFC